MNEVIEPDSPGAESTELLILGGGCRIQGIVEEGFGGVMDAFLANFTERQERGCGCTIYLAGRPVVDLWGGIADSNTRRPWEPDTAAVIFSCSKGILAICTYVLVQEGLLDLDCPIADYWPEFGENGKSRITLRQAMSHRAGLPALDVNLTRNQVLDWDPVIKAIEDQRPLYSPLEGHAYHAMTYGWLVGEVIRRVTGSRPGAYFQIAIAKRLGLRTWIGLPAAARPSVAWMEPPLPDADSEAARRAAQIMDEDPTVERSLSMGGAFPFPIDVEGVVSFNDPVLQAGEIPAANGISTARSLARLYGACVSEVDGWRLMFESSIEDAINPLSEGPQASGMPDDGARWGTGFQLSSPPFHPMLGSTSFGHAGAGGQLAFADADAEIGFAYLSCQMGGYADVRARALTQALTAAVK